MYFVRFHPEVTSCLLSRGKTKYATLGMRLWCKYIRNYLLVYQLISHFLPYLRIYKEFKGEISDLQLEKYGLSFETKKYTTSGWVRGDENVIGIRAFNNPSIHKGKIPTRKDLTHLQTFWSGHLFHPPFIPVEKMRFAGLRNSLQRLAPSATTTFMLCAMRRWAW